MTTQNKSNHAAIAGSAIILAITAGIAALMLKAQANPAAPLDLAATIRPNIETATARVANPTSTQAARVSGTARAVDGLTQTFAYLPTMLAYTQSAVSSGRTATARVFISQTQMAQTAAAQAVLVDQARQKAGLPQARLPLIWPPGPFTTQQIADARACDVAAMYKARYDNVAESDLLAGDPPQTACDFAVLAAAIAYRAETSDPPRPVSPAGVAAYKAAVAANPALAVRSWLVYGDFGPGSLVEPPPFTRQPVKTVMMSYSFGGIGYSGDSTVIVSEADTGHPIVTGQIHEDTDYVPEGGTPLPPYRPPEAHVDPALVQALGRSLTDLAPVDAQFYAIACYDYYPDWEVLIVYEDGTTVSLATNGTNFLGGGGPWQVTIDGQPYMHVSSAIPSAVDALARALGIPGGSTSAMSCGGSDDFIDLAFPAH